MKMLLIANPCSGRKKIQGVFFEILQIFCKAGYVITTHITTKKGNAVEVVSKAKEEKYDIIVCCGGDGTLNEVLTGLMMSDCSIPIGYIPSGSTNDFARSLGLETDMIKAAKSIVESNKCISIDSGRFNENRYFSYIASFGMFTSVSYTTQQSAKNALGHMAYVFEGIANMGNIDSYHISFVADGRSFEGDYIYGGITNSTSVGGMFKFDSAIVDLSDGLFEVLMIKKPKNANEYMKIFTGITTGDFSDTSVFDFCKASRVELNMPKKLMWTLDGESARGDTNLVLENLHKSIRLVV